MQSLLDDNNVDILLTLTLKELRLACQTDKHFNQLCQHPRLKRKMAITIEKVNHFLSFLKTSCVVQPTHLIPYDYYHQLMHEIGMEDPMLSDLQYKKDFNIQGDYDDSMDFLKVRFIKFYNDHMEYHMTDRTEIVYSEENVIVYKYNGHLKEFLTHLIYDNMIFTF